MKKLSKFQAENHKSVTPIDENRQSSFKGGRIFSGGFVTLQPAQREVKKSNPLEGTKSLGSFAEFRAAMFGGK